MKFLASTVWPAITAQLASAKKRRIVVSAYLGSGASKLLPLRKRDTLVVNGSLQTLKTGATNPYELDRFLKRGVKCYSVEALHSKLCIADDYVIIGSANASMNSHQSLIEASLLLKSGAIADEVEDWIESLPLEPIDAKRLTNMKKAYRPPKWGVKAPSAKRPRVRGKVWLTWIKGETEEPQTTSFESRKVAAKKRQENATAEPFFITQPGTKLGRVFKGVSAGDRVIVIDLGEKPSCVYPPLRVLARPFSEKVEGKTVQFLLLEDDEGWMSLKDFRAGMRRLQVDVPSGGKANKQIPQSATLGLSRLWD